MDDAALHLLWQLRRDLHRDGLKSLRAVSLLQGGAGQLDIFLRAAGTEIRINRLFDRAARQLPRTVDPIRVDENTLAALRLGLRPG